MALGWLWVASVALGSKTLSQEGEFRLIMRIAGKASSCTATGLTSGTQYWFQVCAIGAAGPSAWSDPATKRAT